MERNVYSAVAVVTRQTSASSSIVVLPGCTRCGASLSLPVSLLLGAATPMQRVLSRVKTTAMELVLHDPLHCACAKQSHTCDIYVTHPLQGAKVKVNKLLDMCIMHLIQIYIGFEWCKTFRAIWSPCGLRVWIWH
jgi:hypothetical protein